MPFNNRLNFSYNKTDSLNESIDYDFYDEPYFDGDRQFGSGTGVRSVELKPLKNFDASDRSQSDERVCSKGKSDLLKSSSNKRQDSIQNSEAQDTSDSSGDESGIDSRSHYEDGNHDSSVGSSSTPSSDLTNITSRSSFSKESNDNLSDDEYKDDFCITSQSTTEDSPSENDVEHLTNSVQHMKLRTKRYEPARSFMVPNHTIPKPKRISMTFTNEQVRQINRENDILLRKITANAKPRRNSLSTVHSTPKIKASSFVNRSKQQKQIERENIVLLRRLSEVKSSQRSGCLSRKSS